MKVIDTANSMPARASRSSVPPFRPPLPAAMPCSLRRPATTRTTLPAPRLRVRLRRREVIRSADARPLTAAEGTCLCTVFRHRHHRGRPPDRHGPGHALRADADDP
ncbi:hypothetical protein GCM10023235_76850 [Kitasatospora terrestris]|uniref:Uncharacterized protein n=1 Tax=Kitasatospora terrestris TaxID=258051 RepID=A0ABP9EQ80_9ACTN